MDKAFAKKFMRIGLIVLAVIFAIIWIISDSGGGSGTTLEPEEVPSKKCRALILWTDAMNEAEPSMEWWTIRKPKITQALRDCENSGAEYTKFGREAIDNFNKTQEKFIFEINVNQ